MHEPFKRFTQEVKTALMEAIRSPEVKDLIAKTKEAADAGSFEVVISTADLDRQGETIDQNGWDLVHYQENPVVLWGHDYYSLPIGITDTIEVADGKLTAKGRFAPSEANPFAQQVRKLYDLKIVRATSVGFIARETEERTITKAELLEFSFVPVPANPFALSLDQAKELGLDAAMLKAKGFALKAKAEEGEACMLEDGTEGSYQYDENGELMCMPKMSETQSVQPELKDIEKIGAELSAMQSTIDNAIVEHGHRIIEIVQGNEESQGEEEMGEEEVAEASATEPTQTTIAAVPAPRGEGGAAPTVSPQERYHKPSPQKAKGAEQNQRSAVPGLETAIKDINEFFMVRSILRAFTTQATQALERMNKKTRGRKGA